jgi:hypothetical protein
VQCAEVGYQVRTNLRDGRGQVANPFFDVDRDYRFYLAVNLGLDRLLDALAASSRPASRVSE